MKRFRPVIKWIEDKSPRPFHEYEQAIVAALDGASYLSEVARETKAGIAAVRKVAHMIGWRPTKSVHARMESHTIPIGGILCQMEGRRCAAFFVVVHATRCTVSVRRILRNVKSGLPHADMFADQHVYACSAFPDGRVKYSGVTLSPWNGTDRFPVRADGLPLSYTIED